MTWVKVDVDCTEHPKLVGLSDAAWVMWLHGLTYAGRNLSDGFIPTGMMSRLCNTKNPRRAADELVKAGLWDVSPDGWTIHDYLEHQRSADSVTKHKRASSKGALRANHNQHHVARGVVDPACELCADDQSLLSGTDGDTDSETGPPLSVNGQQSKKDIKKEPDAANDHHQLTSVAASAPAVADVIAVVADHQLAQALDRDPFIENPQGYRVKIARRLTTDDFNAIAQTIADHPDWTLAQLAAKHGGPLTSLDDIIGGAA